ncbi:DUF262 domain-containing protein [Demequina rhizosphaerae]|uniref:DUF262 domain-containing protein n=1 Tax=Demequina rhizosphaerae TaxID=1638985 RepID=UPI000AE68FC5|nr:DUF262 domain-containing protein [Demequina rhizosphaerae]
MTVVSRPAELMRKLVISDDLSGEFFVPSYQRGYRWGATEVVKLLDDIESEVIAASAPRSYYLQPIVVMWRDAHSNWELIDGQQRLTTLYLIVKYLRDSNWLPRAKVNYSLVYETRDNSRDYLDTLEASLRHSNIDFHYMYSAYEAIESWFESRPDPEGAAINIRKALSEHVYVIWYEAPEGTDRNELFRRLNVGRIPLTDAELIKALVLSKVGAEGGRAERQEQVAVQWDAFERDLRDPEMWAFITGSDRVWPTHVDLLFRAMAGSTGGNEQHRYWVFEQLRPRIEESASDFWRAVVRMHGLVTGWFHDRELYHLIGFLIATGERYEFERIVDLADGLTNKAFRLALMDRVRARMGRTVAGLDDLNYEKHRDECQRLLLLMNVATVLGRDGDGNRFSFYAHAGGEWSVEHIHAQNAAPLTRAEQWKTWLELHRRAIASLPGRDGADSTNLFGRIDAFIGAIDKGELGIEARFRELEEEILTYFALSGDAVLGDDVHLLPNLALLERGHNSALGNSVFEVKRQEILRRDRRGEYIPPCTRNVFLKYYTDDADQQLHVWGPQDRQAYYKQMRDVLRPYLVRESEEEVAS